MKKVLAIFIVMALVGLLGWHAYQKASTARKASARQHRTVAVAVEVAPIQRATIRDVGFFAGSLLPKSYFVVAPKVAGR